jgi:hypothetical protein
MDSKNLSFALVTKGAKNHLNPLLGLRKNEFLKPYILTNYSEIPCVYN